MYLFVSPFYSAFIDRPERPTLQPLCQSYRSYPSVPLLIHYAAVVLLLHNVHRPVLPIR